MQKSILIIGMGQGLSLGIAEKFGREGYQIGMISRNAENLENYKRHLKAYAITSEFAIADVTDTEEMISAIQAIRAKLGEISVLHYNAVDYRMMHLMNETVENLTRGFVISVANAYAASLELVEDLAKNKGAILITGGASGITPSPDMASISLGKAGIRNLSLQLHQVLKQREIFVGTITIGGRISREVPKYSPDLLAEMFWDLHIKRDQAEIVY